MVLKLSRGQDLLLSTMLMKSTQLKPEMKNWFLWLFFMGLLEREDDYRFVALEY